MSATAEAEPAAGWTAAELLDRCDLWIWRLASRFARSHRLSVRDVRHEIVVDVFLHAAEYDPRRGKPTTWVSWRARNVVTRMTTRRGRVRSAVQFSQFDARGDGIPAAEAVPCPHGEATPALDQADDDQELARVLDAALAELSPARRATIAATFGLDGAPPRNGSEVAAERGVSREAIRVQRDGAKERLREHAGLRQLAEARGLDPDADHLDGVLVRAGRGEL